MKGINYNNMTIYIYTIYLYIFIYVYIYICLLVHYYDYYKFYFSNSPEPLLVYVCHPFDEQSQLIYHYMLLFLSIVHIHL